MAAKPYTLAILACVAASAASLGGLAAMVARPDLERVYIGFGCERGQVVASSSPTDPALGGCTSIERHALD